MDNLTEDFEDLGKFLEVHKDKIRLLALALNTMNPRNLPLQQPQAYPGANQKFVVRACSGGKSKTIRFGDPKMTIKKSIPARSKDFRARHRCDSNPPGKLTAQALVL
jgi:hypothetical protein